MNTAPKKATVKRERGCAASQPDARPTIVAGDSEERGVTADMLSPDGRRNDYSFKMVRDYGSFAAGHVSFL
jgi:hypothetical protein